MARLPSDPTRDGWRFAGWYNAAGERFLYDHSVSNDEVWTARWQLRVSYNLNGGTSSYAIDDVYLDPGEQIGSYRLPSSLTKARSTLLGWTTNTDDDPPELVKSYTRFYEPVTLYAAWDSNVKVAGKDYEIYVSWNSGVKCTKIEVLSGVSLVASTEPSLSATSCTFKDNLENGIEYTVKVYLKNDEPQIFTVTPHAVVKHSDYLMIMYLDGDNDLYNPIFHDLNEVEYGLYGIRCSDDSPETGYASVNVVALWDGYGYVNAKSCIYEVGRDYTLDTYLNPRTKDLTYTAKFIQKNEVDMSNKDTVTSFVQWALERYDADHIILQFSNHGGGPRAFTPSKVQLEDGRTVSLPGSDDRRSMCWDETSGGKTFLKTADIPVALKAAGIDENHKIDMIIEDVCLGGSIEEAYELRTVAKYLVASPNNIPSDGLNYVQLMKKFKSNTTMSEIGKGIVKDYYEFYQLDGSDWNQVLQSEGWSNQSLSEILTRTQYASTLSCIDLSKMDAVKNAVNSLASVILDNRNTLAGDLTYRDTGEPVLYADYIRDMYLRQYGQLSYAGTFTHLFDAGWLAESLELESADTYVDGNGITKNNPTKWPALHTAAVNLRKALSNAIVASWRDGFSVSGNSFTASEGLYNTTITDATPFEPAANKRTWCGLTISGGTVEYSVSGNIVYPADERYPDFYKTDLAFGRDTRWGDVLELFFGN